MPQRFIDLNIENGITLFLMILLMYFAVRLMLTLISNVGDSGSSGSQAPGFSWASNVNFAA